MRLVLLGVRGSTPAPGPEFVRYGGHTSCVAVMRDGDVVPSLVLDAGTGLRDLGGLLGGAAFTGAIMLSHLHWDHVQGLPFCPSLDRPDACTELYLPVPADDCSAAELLARGMSPPHFPIGPEGLRGTWRFTGARAGKLAVSGCTVTLAKITHRGGLTYGIRVEADGASVAYLPDHAPTTGPAAAEVVAAGVDVLLHDAQFLPAERAQAAAYGHSTLDDAIEFADRCGARRLILTHHAPARTDGELDEIAGCVRRSAGTIAVARQGDVLSIEP